MISTGGRLAAALTGAGRAAAAARVDPAAYYDIELAGDAQYAASWQAATFTRLPHATLEELRRGEPWHRRLLDTGWRVGDLRSRHVRREFLGFEDLREPQGKQVLRVFDPSNLPEEPRIGISRTITKTYVRKPSESRPVEISPRPKRAAARDPVKWTGTRPTRPGHTPNPRHPNLSPPF